MIYIFRKEMRKWKNILWLVLASLVLGGAAGIFFRRKDPNEIKIASVNGQKISYRQFNRVLREIRASVDMYKAYAKAYGLPIDMFLNMEGLDNPEEKAFEKCIKNKLVDQVKNDFRISLDRKVFRNLLANSLPNYLVEPTGKINIDAYKNYLHRLGTTIPEYEESKEMELGRTVVENLVKNSYYSSLNLLKESLIADDLKKKFKIVTFPFDAFLQRSKGEKISDDKLMEFFQKNKSDYRVGAKAKVKYWIITPKDYEKQVVIDTESLERYYERNKSSLFRIPPKVKLRRILFKESDDAKAREVLEKAKRKPEIFADLARQYSKDEQTIKTGGLIDFFDKGTYDPEFEKAAFRLKKPGELSGIVKTKDGLEILKLEERISASHKPLQEVKDEILKTLKSKKALLKLQGDIKTVLYKTRSNKNAIEEFAKEMNLTPKQTSWLTRDDTGESSIKSLLAERLLSYKKDSKKKYGSFVHDGQHILYLLQEKQKSYLPSLKDVHDKVLNDLYEDKAKKDLKQQVKLAKRDILLGKLSLQETADKNKLEITQTDMITRKDKIKGLDVTPALINKMFILSDIYQVLKKKEGKDYYLIKLDSIHFPKDKELKKIKPEDVENSIERKSAVAFDAFIASLFRVARIEREEISNTLLAKQEI